MSTDTLAEFKRLTGREARAAAAAVARAVHAERVSSKARELARTVRSAERVMAARGLAMEPVESPLGIAVPAVWLGAGEGCAVSDRMGRFVFLRQNTRAPLMLPPWSVESMALSRVGVRAVNQYTRLRSFDRVRSELVAVLRARDNDARRALSRIPKGATLANVLATFPRFRAAILETLAR